MENITKENNQKLSSVEEFLNYALQKPLPGANAHKLMIPEFPDIAPEYFSYNEKLRDAAVLIILFEEAGVLKTVLIERMPDPGPHSGQIAFPGGRYEETDADLTETALREAYEETGVRIDRSKVAGSLTPIQIPVSGYSVLPVISIAGSLPEFVRCEAEVKDIFVVGLYELLESETKQRIVARGIEIDAPCFIFNERVVWGATAMVLKELKTIISQI